MGESVEPQLTYGRRRKSRAAGIAVAIAVHALVAWMLINRTILIEQTKVRGGEVIAYLAPLAKDKPTPKPSKAAPPPPRTKTPPKPRIPLDAPKQNLVQSDRVAILAQPIETPPTPPTPAKVEEPPLDMMAQIEANRRRRAEQNAAQEPAGGGESEAQRANRIARANIAQAVGKGQDKDDTGGMFQIRNQTFNSADISFKGWNTNFKRNWSQLVRVEQGGEPDIEVAVVKKMIEIIRQHKQEDFIWESHRLGRNITLSARPRDTAELQSFLLKEFYPNYRNPNARG
ncbi:MAG TPA: hypothetical protein VIT92_09545 [Burkholderiaceae bacterium]